MQKTRVDYRFGELTLKKLQLLHAKLGLSETAIVELAIARLAGLEDVDQYLTQESVDNLRSVQRYHVQRAKDSIIH